MNMTEARKNVKGFKQVKFSGLKTTPSRPTDDQLARINQFTRRAFTADELYVGQLRLANNCIDRDNERFSEEVLQRFAATAIRKTMLFDHSRESRNSAVGKFFDVGIEKMALQQAIAETGEELTLPAGVIDVWFLSPWFYIPVKGVAAEVLEKIDAGINDFASIGFRAETLIPVSDSDGKTLYWEYRGTGRETEMTEGSLVYLGAQYGMSVKTPSPARGEGRGEGGDPELRTPDSQLASHPPDGKGKSQEGGDKTMEKFLKMLSRLFPGKTFSEDGVESELRAAIAEDTTKSVDTVVAEKDARIKALEPLEARVAELTPLAADGKAYRDSLVVDYVAKKTKLGECPETPEAQEDLKKIVAGYPMAFLKTEVDHLQKRVETMFPAGSQLEGKDDLEKRDKSKAGGKKENPLTPKKQ